MEKREEGTASSSSSSYRYWVRDLQNDAVPVPQPRMLGHGDHHGSNPPTLGSAWNKAGTWEEKSLNKWASQRLKELLMSVGPVELPGGCGPARICAVSKCEGDAFVVTVRNKRRVGYTYELSLRVEAAGGNLKAHLDIPDISFGETQDVHFQVRLPQQQQQQQPDFSLFLQPIRDKLLQFEHELQLHPS